MNLIKENYIDNEAEVSFWQVILNSGSIMILSELLAMVLLLYIGMKLFDYYKQGKLLDEINIAKKSKKDEELMNRPREESVKIKDKNDAKINKPKADQYIVVI